MKTHDLQWYDLFGRRATRPDFLRIGAGAAGLIALGTLPGCGGEPSFRFSSNPFALGVASGDPSSDGVVLWSRLAREALEGVGATTEQVAVGWEIAEDNAFSRIVQSGSVLALPELGHSVHLESIIPGDIQLSNAEFTESLELVAEAGVRFAGVLCGRATWKDGIPVYGKDGLEAFRKWLDTDGVRNISNVNDRLKAASAWYASFGVSSVEALANA